MGRTKRRLTKNRRPPRALSHRGFRAGQTAGACESTRRPANMAVNAIGGRRRDKKAALLARAICMSARGLPTRATGAVIAIPRFSTNKEKQP